VAALQKHQLMRTAADRGFGSLFENNHTVIVILDPQSLAVVDANPAAASFYGWSREAMRGMTIDAISIHSRAELRASLQAALQSPRDSRLAVHRLADGSLREVEIHRGPFESDGRELVYAIVHDVTERRQAEEAQARLATILEVTLDLVSICEADGRLLYLNPAGRRMLGVDSGADVTQFHVHDFAPAPSAQTAMLDSLAIAARDGVWKGESELQSLGGARLSVSQVIQAHRDPRGGLLFLSTISRDIGARSRNSDSRAPR
jgi:PAS domain S-box-containing protein